jgi:hypothetical protein
MGGLLPEITFDCYGYYCAIHTQDVEVSSLYLSLVYLTTPLKISLCI